MIEAPPRQCIDFRADLGTINAGIINNLSSNPTAGIRLNSAYSIPGTWARYLDLAATGSAAFLKHEALELSADGDATFGGALQADEIQIRDAAAALLGVIEAVSGDLWLSASQDLRLQADQEVQLAPTGDLVLVPSSASGSRVDFDVPASGSAGSLVGYIEVKIQGTVRKIPYYAVS